MKSKLVVIKKLSNDTKLGKTTQDLPGCNELT